MQNIRFDLPKDVKYIINLLSDNGYEGYVVGGCVRDMLLNITPRDFDIATNARPEEIIKIFNDKSSHLILNGLKHGTVGVFYRGQLYEITTFRIDGVYKDNRRPDKVQFTKNLHEDLGRRDFTINAMAYNDDIGFIDLFKGLEDLNSKTIRSVGEPTKRFTEDALRLMRAVRFSAKYNFTIEEDTLNAIGETSIYINKIAMERIQIEFDKILLYNPKHLLTLNECNILKNLPCKLVKEEYFFLNIEKNVKVLSRSREDLNLRLAILFQNVKDINSLLKSMKYDKKTIKHVGEIVNNIMVLEEMKDCSIREVNIKLKEVLGYIGMQNMKDIIYINKLNAQNLYDESHDFIKESEDKYKYYNNIENVLKDIEEKEECFSLDKLNISGKELCSLGIRGKEIGIVLDYLLREVIKDNTLNEKDILNSMIKSM